MFRFIFALYFLTALAAAPAEEKTFPEWPKAFSMTLQITEPWNTPAGASGPYDAKFWFDDEEGNLKRQIGSQISYVLEKYEGRGVAVQVDASTDTCTFRYAGPLGLEARSPLPEPPENPQFLGNANLDGAEVEKWRFDHEGETSEAFIIIYLKRQGGLALPVRFESYEDLPPVGSDMILPFVVEVKEFSASKPPAAVFEFDTSKCREAPKTPLKIKDKLRALSLLNVGEKYVFENNVFMF